MRVARCTALLCAAIVTAGCAPSDSYTSSETNLANIPLPKVATSKTHQSKHARSRQVRPASPHLLPNGMPG
jgi:hypothetical protein